MSGTWLKGVKTSVYTILCIVFSVALNQFMSDFPVLSFFI